LEFGAGSGANGAFPAWANDYPKNHGGTADCDNYIARGPVIPRFVNRPVVNHVSRQVPHQPTRI